MQQGSKDDSLDFPRLLHDAIGQAVAHEDPDRFMNWFREHLADYQTEASDGSWLDAAFTAVLGRAIWNAVPLPGNSYKPQPLPEPGRNEPCFCGSGEKYKRCCAGSPNLPLDPEAVLPTALDLTPPEVLAKHIQGGRVPVTAIVDLANRRYERDELWNAVVVLEPLFEGDLRRTDESHGRALDVLCDLYMELGHDRKKDKLLQRIVTEAPRSPLRSEAWQRLAILRLDQGDADGAWEAFHQARQDHPDAPGIGLLEIQLLMSRGRAEEAQERAGFWEKRLRRQGAGDDDRLVTFFTAIARDPRGVMTDMGIKAAGGAGGRLVEWLRQVADRPVPDYEPAVLSGAAPAAPNTAKHTGPRQDTSSAGPPDAPLEPVETLWLMPPEALEALESRWRTVFPFEKPASVHDAPSWTESPWDAGHEPQWMDFLEQNPEAFDSLEILDDLSTALVEHAQYGADWLDHALVAPLLARAEAIVDHALRDRSDPRLSWFHDGNRPVLRSLARRVYLQTRRGDAEGATRAAERMLALNPQDDHGFKKGP